RTLPASPTRRSSDLTRRKPSTVRDAQTSLAPFSGPRYAGGVRTPGRPRARRVMIEQEALNDVPHPDGAEPRVVALEERVRQLEQDRKSTRLNSSHLV